MSLKIAVPKATTEGERRVAATPDTVKKLVALGCEVAVEKGAGAEASYTDDMFKAAGAKIAASAAEACKDAAIVIAVRAPSDDEIKIIPKGALLIGMLSPYNNEKLVNALARAGIDAFAMELVPRITRAQAMDVLSSQSNLAGYKAVLDATEHYTRVFPMMMTAAGTVPPTRVFIMGAGVAGLQAIATARRLGAIVSATDVRPAAKEQVASLGASFVAVEDEEFKQAETAGGYAKEMSDEYKKKQQALIEETIAKQDIVITTALIPGRPAPRLISADMVKSMKPGSVIVDLAVEQGGNCELSEPGKVVRKHNVTIVGHKNVPGRLATDASALYAKNILNLLNLLIDKEGGKLAVNWDDDIVKGIALTKDGRVVHPQFSSAPKETAKDKTEEKGKLVEVPEEETKPKTASRKKAPAEPAKKTAAAKDEGAGGTPNDNAAPAKKAAKKSTGEKKD